MYVYIKYIYTYTKDRTMDTKLTVRLNKDVIEKAKEYAANHKVSLSKMIESYLDSLTRKSSENIEITPLVESLSGVVQLDESYDFKSDYTNYLSNKYK